LLGQMFSLQVAFSGERRLRVLAGGFAVANKVERFTQNEG